MVTVTWPRRSEAPETGPQCRLPSWGAALDETLADVTGIVSRKRRLTSSVGFPAASWLRAAASGAAHERVTCPLGGDLKSVVASYTDRGGQRVACAETAESSLDAAGVSV